MRSESIAITFLNVRLLILYYYLVLEFKSNKAKLRNKYFVTVYGLQLRSICDQNIYQIQLLLLFPPPLAYLFYSDISIKNHGLKYNWPCQNIYFNDILSNYTSLYAHDKTVIK